MRTARIKFFKYPCTGLILAVLLLLLSCEKEEIKNKDYLSGVIGIKVEGENTISTSEQTKEITLGETISFLVYHISYDGCGIYSKHEVHQQGNDFELTFYAKTSDPSGACTDNLATVKTGYKFTPLQKGTFYLRFRQQKENTFLIYNVIVK